MRNFGRRISRWVDRQTKERPFFSALFVLLIVIVPGYSRLESSVNTAERAANSAAATAEQLAGLTKSTQKANCQTRNTAQARGRERFDKFFTGIELVFTSTPGQSEERKQATREFIARLRSAVPLDPSIEDVDCDSNGKLDSEDYAL